VFISSFKFTKKQFFLLYKVACGTLIHKPCRPAKDSHYLHSARGDSKTLPDNRTAKVLIFSQIGALRWFLSTNIYDYLTYSPWLKLSFCRFFFAK
jgi:hypothetical protein